MSNPFRQKMPLGIDTRIRLRLLRAWITDHKAFSLSAFLVPVLALWMFVVNVGETPTIDTDLLVSEIRAAQAADLAAAESNIYHVTREITEGYEKPAYVADVLGSSTVAMNRTDRVETYQHSDTALALVESNGTNRSFEAFLSREHDDGELSLHHFGPKTGEVGQERAAYDQAHDLASLYTDFTSLDRPSVPVLSEEAEFVAVDEETNQAQFRLVVNDIITIDSYVDIDSKQVVEDVIYVKGLGDAEYEMTRVTYSEREIIPAEKFEEVFDPTEYNYAVIDSKLKA